MRLPVLSCIVDRVGEIKPSSPLSPLLAAMFRRGAVRSASNCSGARSRKARCSTAAMRAGESAASEATNGLHGARRFAWVGASASRSPIDVRTIDSPMHEAVQAVLSALARKQGVFLRAHNTRCWASRTTAAGAHHISCRLPAARPDVAAKATCPQSFPLIARRQETGISS